MRKMIRMEDSVHVWICSSNPHMSWLCWILYTMASIQFGNPAGEAKWPNVKTPFTSFWGPWNPCKLQIVWVWKKVSSVIVVMTITIYIIIDFHHTSYIMGDTGTSYTCDTSEIFHHHHQQHHNHTATPPQTSWEYRISVPSSHLIFTHHFQKAYCIIMSCIMQYRTSLHIIHHPIIIWWFDKYYWLHISHMQALELRLAVTWLVARWSLEPFWVPRCSQHFSGLF